MRWKIIAVLVITLALALTCSDVAHLATTSPAQESVGKVPAPHPLAAEVTTRELHPGYPHWLSVALVVLSLTTLISVVITFYLYRWRRILLTRPNLLVPEEWGKYLNGIGHHLDTLTSSFERGVGALTTKTSEQSDKLANMLETFMTLQTALDEKDAEIRRFKKGYDAEVFRKFLSRFIRVDQSINGLIEAGNANQNSLEQIKRLLEDAFDECGVESFQPTIGEDYRRTTGIADNPKTQRTDNPQDAFKIAEVLQAGYRLRNGDGYEVIIPARVRIFLLQE